MEKDLVKQAKAILKEKSGLNCTLLYLLCTVGLSTLVTWTMPSLSGAFLTGDMEEIQATVQWAGGLAVFAWLLLGVFSVITKYGYQMWALSLARGQSPTASTLLQGFGQSGKIMGLEVLVFCLLYIVMTVPLMALGLGALPILFLSMASEELFIFLSGVAMLLLLAVIFSVTIAFELRFSFRRFSMMDYPDKGILIPLSYGLYRQKHHRKSMVRLYIRFLPWFFLTAFCMYLPELLSLAYNALNNPPPVWDTLAYTQLSQPTTGSMLLSMVVQWGVMIRYTPLFHLSLALFYQHCVKETSVDPSVLPSFLKGES